MSRGDENLDQLFKNAFSGQKHTVDPAFWQGAQQLINAEKIAATPFYAKPLFLIASVITITISAVLFSDSTPESQNENTQILASINQNTSIKKQINKETNPTINATNNITSSNPLPSHTVANSELKRIKTKTEDKEVAQNYPNNPDIMNPFIKSKAPKASGINLNQGANNNGSMNGFSDGTPSNKTETKPAIAKTAFSSLKKLKEHHLNLKNNSLIQDVSYTNQGTNNNSFELSPMATFSMQQLESVQFENQNPQAHQKSHKSLNKPFNLRASIGQMWSKESIDSQTGISHSSGEKSIEISLEYQFKKRWGIQSGLKIAQIQTNQNVYVNNIEDLSYWNEEQIITTNQNRVWWMGGWYYYPATNDTSISKTWVKQTDTTNQTVHLNHKIRVIEIPLLITYNYGINRFNLQLSSGISVGLPIGSSGTSFISTDPYPSNIENSNVLNHVQTNFLFQSEIAYGLNDNWWLGVRPQLKYNLNSIYNSDSSISPQVLFFGLNTGLIYKF
ncbi:MAG: hypothetical protein ACPGRC_01040 [Salibacteraceae bacterium]